MSGQPYQKADDFAACRLRWGRTPLLRRRCCSFDRRCLRDSFNGDFLLLAAATTFGQPE